MPYKLPVKYDSLKPYHRIKVREQYIKEQNNLCFFCKENLFEEAPAFIKQYPIKLELFPPNFMNSPIHLQHNHNTGLTEGAVHNYCNAVMWMYLKR